MNITNSALAYRIKWSILYRVRKRWIYRYFLFNFLLKKKNYNLHIGCGHDYLDDFLNIDASKEAKADIYMDMRDLNKYCISGSVNLIKMIHVLSYLRYWEAIDFLTVCYQLLKEDGKIIIEIPDIHKLSHEIVNIRSIEKLTDIKMYFECLRAIYAFNMKQIEQKKHFTTYAFGWSAIHLEYELKKIGFKSVNILTPICHDKLPWRDFRIEAKK